MNDTHEVTPRTVRRMIADALAAAAVETVADVLSRRLNARRTRGGMLDLGNDVWDFDKDHGKGGWIRVSRIDRTRREFVIVNRTLRYDRAAWVYVKRVNNA